MNIKETYRAVKIEAPELAENEAFVEWLHKSCQETPRCATWHTPLENGSMRKPDSTSDLFVWKDAGLEGSDSDMPQEVWEQICKTVGEDFVGVIWITFF